MDYLGIFNKGRYINGSQVYSRRNGQQEITFRWMNDTTAALLNKDGQALESSNVTTKKCLFENNIENNNFSDDLQIRAFDSHKTYYNHDDKNATTLGH